MGENKEFLVLYTKEYLKNHPNINFFIYGHRHIELDLMLSVTSRVLILGDWIKYFSYAVFDGENLFLEEYIDGVTQGGFLLINIGCANCLTGNNRVTIGTFFII